jgi:hypothetical protein
MQEESELGQLFQTFFIDHWQDDPIAMYQQGDFSSLFNIDSRLSRYHLVRLVKLGIVVYVKWDSSVWYCHPDQYDKLKEWEEYFSNSSILKVRLGE